MKKTTLLKTLLVAVGLCMGGSAWAQVTTTLLEYGTNDVPWTDSRAAEWTGKAVTVDNDVVKYSGTDNGDFSTSKTISPTSGNIINLTAVWRARSNTGRYWSENAGIYFRFGNIVVAQNDQDNSHGYVFAGLSNMSSVTTFTAGSYRTDIASCTWLKIEAEINTKTNTLTSFTIKSEDGAKTYVSRTNVALSDPDYTTVAFGFQRGGRHTTEKQEQLKSVKITQTTPSVEYADYTVHFVDNNGATVKDDVIRSGEVGATVNANSDDMTTFYSGGNKYIYASDGGGVEVVKAGTAEMTVTYTKYGQFTYNVYAVNSSDVKLQNDPIATATTYVTESATLAWSKYINVGGTWYVSSETTFRTTAAEAGSKNVVYTETDAEDAIDYFFEFEDLEKSGTFASTQDGEGLSKNNSARFGKSSRAWTTAISAGTYTLNIYCYGENAKSPTLPMYYCDTDGSNRVYIGEATACRANNWELKEKTGVVIPEGKALCLYNTDDKNNSNYLVDYFTLTRTDDATVSGTITPAGWSTFASIYPLNLSTLTATSGATAYYASAASGSTVTLTSTTATVPAGEGIMVKGTAGETFTIDVAASGTAISGNKLIGQTTTGDVDASNKDSNGKYHYVFGYVTETPSTYGFYNLASDTSVPAGKAYLETTTALTLPGAARLTIVFDDETTGIQNLTPVLSEGEGVVYNLRGQRVAQPQKGLYIVNGKKVVIK